MHSTRWPPASIDFCWTCKITFHVYRIVCIITVISFESFCWEIYKRRPVPRGGLIYVSGGKPLLPKRKDQSPPILINVYRSGTFWHAVKNPVELPIFQNSFFFFLIYISWWDNFWLMNRCKLYYLFGEVTLFLFSLVLFCASWCVPCCSGYVAKH